jgi:hypothetical protein
MNLKYVPLSAPTMLDSEKGKEGERKEMEGKKCDNKKMMTIINHNNQNNNNDNHNNTNKKIQRRMYQ